MSKHLHPTFLKSLLGVVTIIFLSSQFLIRGLKSKSDFSRIDGRIEYFDSVYQELPLRHKGKFRYLKLDTYPKVFEIFIGKDWGDFSPQHEALDQLSPGDTITIYFDIDPKEKDERLNRLAQYIDINGENIFTLGGRDKIGGIIGIASGILFVIILFYLKRKNKIT